MPVLSRASREDESLQLLVIVMLIMLEMKIRVGLLLRMFSCLEEQLFRGRASCSLLLLCLLRRQNTCRYQLEFKKPCTYVN